MKATKDMTSYEISFVLDDLGITDESGPNGNETISIMNLQDAANEFGIECDILELISKTGKDQYALGGYYGKFPVQNGVIWFELLDLQEIKNHPGCSLRYTFDVDGVHYKVLYR